MSDFVAGFAARHDAASHVLQAAFAPPLGFAAADPRERAAAPARPRHFAPAERGANPTAGWDPLDPSARGNDFLDPLAAAHAAGFAEGQAAALAEARGDHDRDAALLTELAAALRSGNLFDREAMAQRLRQTVLLLVTKVVGETGVAADLLAARVDAAAALLTEGTESALLRLNPADVALVEGKLPAAIFPAGDATIARGSFLLESASTMIEDGPALWLEQLAQAIELVPVPPTC